MHALQNSALRRLAGPVLIALLYYATAVTALAMTQGADGIATIWPPSGILVAALFATRGARWRYVALGAAASLAASLQSGTSWEISLGLAVANVVEALIAAALLRRWCGRSLSFIALADVVRFAAAATVATLVSTAVAWPISGGAFSSPASWFTTDLLGILIVAPMMLIAVTMIREGRGELAGTSSTTGAVVLLVMVAAVTAGVVWQGAYPLLFLPMVALLVATYRLGPFGAAAGIILVAAVSSTAAAFGHDPTGLGHGMRAVALFLQFYYLVLFATAMPVAAVLAAGARLLRTSAESERMYRLLADHSNDMIVRTDGDGIRRYVSPACRTILGFEPDELVGVPAAGTIHPDDRSRVIAVCRTLIDGADGPICAFRQLRADGSYAWLEATYRLVRDPVTGAPVEFIASIRDVARRHAAELAASAAQAGMQEGYRLLSMAERIAQVGHWRLDAADLTMFWSPEVFRIHGMSGSEAPPTDVALATYHPHDREAVRERIRGALTAGTAFDFAVRIVRGDGQVRSIISRGQAERGPDGTVLGVFGVIQDVTRHVEIERELEAARAAAEAAAQRAIEIAETDELTRVASRRKALRRLDREVAAAHAAGTPLSLAIFDVDHFKSVNDRFGHAIGDEVLVRIAHAACGSVRGSDLVGRLGGEEFVAVLPGADTALALTIAERIRASIEAAGGVDDPRVTASVGIATLAPGQDAAQLLHQADCALYAAKSAGRNVLRLAA